MIENSSIWVVTDVDGTLMDHSYDLTPARETIKILQQLSVPVILCTSKTAAEVEIIRKDLKLSDPYIVENGGAIHGEELEKGCGNIILGEKYEVLDKTRRALEFNLHEKASINDLRNEIIKYLNKNFKDNKNFSWVSFAKTFLRTSFLIRSTFLWESKILYKLKINLLFFSI